MRVLVLFLQTGPNFSAGEAELKGLKLVWQLHTGSDCSESPNFPLKIQSPYLFPSGLQWFVFLGGHFENHGSIEDTSKLVSQTFFIVDVTTRDVRFGLKVFTHRERFFRAINSHVNICFRWLLLS